MKHVI